MRIVQKITAHEMARRFAIGETRSQFFTAPDEHYREETLSFLISGNHNLELEGIHRHQQSRGQFVNSIPENAEWHLAKLRLSLDEFNQVGTVRDNGWRGHTGGTFRLIDAANYLREDFDRDHRVRAVVSACQQGRFELQGITLFAQAQHGPYTIIEGTARHVALFLCCVLSESSPICTDDIEVVLGISSARWEFS